MSEGLTASQEHALYWAISVCLVLLAGVISGLNLALFSIDPVYLKVQLKTGSDTQRRQAEKLLPLLHYQHLTLVALLISNAALATALPLFLEELLNPITSLIVSVTAVLFFGEVFPQATFVRKAVPVCSFLSPFIWMLIVVTFVVSYPTSLLLDNMLGHKVEAMEKEQLGAFFSLHEDNPNTADQLRGAEANIMRGAMALSTKKVRDIMKVSVDAAFMLSSCKPLDAATVDSILLSGFSRIPIYKDDSKKHILGALLVKSLLPLCFTNPNPPPMPGDYHLREVLRLSEDTSLYDVYESFQSGQSNMAAVYNAKGVLTGLLTLEDIFECMHNTSITDETDLSAERPLQIEIRQKELIDLYHHVKLEKQRSLSQGGFLQ